MSIKCPAIEWPAALEEGGPIEDPSILLLGTAYLAGKAMQVVAARIDLPQSWALDYKPGAEKSAWQWDASNSLLATLLDELDDMAGDLGNLLGDDSPTIVNLADNPYMVWMLPASFCL